jgi:fluoroquinolone resistance protein
MWSRADLRNCDLRGSDIGDLEPGNVRLQRAIIDWPQAVSVARGLGLDVRTD